MKDGKKLFRMKRSDLFSGPVFRWIVLALAAAALQGVPLLFTRMEGDRGLAWYVMYLYAALPLAAFLIPLWAGLGGVHPFAAFFPVGLALWLLPVYESPGMALACMALSLVGCVTGQEWRKRKSGRKGGSHGGQGNKRK